MFHPELEKGLSFKNKNNEGTRVFTLTVVEICFCFPETKKSKDV